MFTPQDFLDSIEHETRLCQHIHSKADASKVEWSPGEGHRNTLDLMRYLSWCAAVPVEALLAKDWSCAAGAVEKASTMTFEEFPERMDAQLDSVKTLLAGVGESEYVERDGAYPWGEPVKLGVGLVNTSLRFLAAYRLQLFQHVKLTAAPDMGTSNAWMGMDRV